MTDRPKTADKMCGKCGKNVKAQRIVLAKTRVNYDLTTRWNTTAVCTHCAPDMIADGWRRK